MATQPNNTGLDREVWEGWTPRKFIEELEPLVGMIMAGGSWKKPFKDRKELALWCTDNQPYYKREIPEVVDFFARKYNIGG